MNWEPDTFHPSIHPWTTGRPAHISPQQTWFEFSPTTVLDNDRQVELSPTMVPEMSPGS